MPSLGSEAFIIQYRATLAPNDLWISLSTNFPATAGTNWTTFIHSNAVTYPSGCPTNGGGGSWEGPPGPGSMTAVQTEQGTFFLTEQGEAVTLDELLPYPWNPRFTSRSSGAKFSTANAGSPAEGTESSVTSTSDCSPTLGFYRVVRRGVAPFGWTTNQVLQGIVTIDLEMGSVGGVSDFGLYAGITNDSQLDPIPGFDFLLPTNGALRATWDTTQVTNGTYRIIFGANVGNGNVPSLEGRAFTATVSNTVWFPDSFNWAGYFIEVQAQSIYANAPVHVDVYDESGFQFVSLDTTTDSEGFMTYDGVRGFRLINYDENGEQYPDEVYTVVVSTAPSGGSGSGPSAATASTNFIWKEAAWPTNSPGNLDTQFAIAYMPVFGDPSLGNSSAVTLQTMIQNVYLAAQSRNGYSVIRGDDQNPFELNNVGNWITLGLDLRVDEVRNFYYFGHGNPGWIGTKNLSTNPPVVTFLDIWNVETALNNKPVTTTRPRHPYRFVFLDGCSTAKGNLCQTFGIPKKKVAGADFTKKGLRYRAFMGWDNAQVIALVGSITTPHVTFVSNFYSAWSLPDENGYKTLRQSIDASKGAWTEVDKHLKVYGYEGLLFRDTIP